MVNLTRTNLDFNEILEELKADLQTREAFKALFPGETANIFVEHGAGITALMLYAINSATQNAFLPTAFSKESVYALASTLGVPPRRKLGAVTTLQVTVDSPLSTSLTLPKFTRFSGRNLEWYTTEDILIPASPTSQTLSLSVRQGERVTDTFISTGQNNQRLEIGEDFNVDDQFLNVFVDSIEYENNGASLLDSQRGDLVYAQQTSSNGRVLILFGNNILGSIPNLGSTIEISYANTAGADSNSSIIGDTFLLLDSISLGGGSFLQATAITLEASTGGLNEESTEQIKLTAPRLFAANQRAVTRNDYIGHILRLTGASAANTWGEFEEAKQKSFQNLTMMNRAFVSAIPPNTEKQNTTPFTGFGNVDSFSGNVGYTNILPGSMQVTSLSDDNVNVIFEDRDGKGILVSDQVDFNNIDISDPNTEAFASENNTDASLAFDGTDAFNSPGVNSWESTTIPTIFNPVRIAFQYEAGDEKRLRSFRITSSAEILEEDRGFPTNIVILGSTIANADINSRDDWEVIRGAVNLTDPGYRANSKWICVDDKTNTTEYRSFAIEILGTNNNGVVKINNISAQSEDEGYSTIDYVTGDVNLEYKFDPTNTTFPGNGQPIETSAVNGNFTQLEKDNLLSSLNNLNHFTTMINYRDAVAVPVDVIAEVRYLEGFNPNTIRSNVEKAIDDLFEPDGNTLDEPFYLSDIYQAIQDVDGVDFSVVKSPLSNVDTEIDQFVLLRSKTLTILPSNR